MQSTSSLIQSQSPSSSSDLQLRRAVEEQLDLILKMQQQRKALKKQNRLLHMKIKQTTNIMAKYHKDVKQMEVNTDQNYSISVNVQKNSKQKNDSKTDKKQVKKIFTQFGIQAELDIVNNSNIMNCSKLTQAQSMLKAYTNQSRVLNNAQLSNIQQVRSKQKDKQKQKILAIQQSKVTKTNNSQQDKQIAGEILRITKQLNTVKRQLKQSQHKYKLRDKQIKDLKKCLDTKNQALEKSRKQFNQLSQVLNSDRSKSIRNMEQQIASLKAKLIGLEDSVQLKNMLLEVTQQYQNYRKQSERKIQIFVSEIAAKEKQIYELQKSQKRINSMSEM